MDYSLKEEKKGLKSEWSTKTVQIVTIKKTPNQNKPHTLPLWSLLSNVRLHNNTTVTEYLLGKKDPNFQIHFWSEQDWEPQTRDGYHPGLDTRSCSVCSKTALGLGKHPKLMSFMPAHQTWVFRINQFAKNECLRKKKFKYRNWFRFCKPNKSCCQHAIYHHFLIKHKKSLLVLIWQSWIWKTKRFTVSKDLIITLFPCRIMHSY